MTQRTVSIIQARMESKRLPGKVLMDIQGKPMLQRVFDRIAQAEVSDEIVIATSVEHSDDPIAEYCEEQNMSCFRGSPSDVLARYYNAAKEYGADIVVRFTADCPLLDPTIIQKVVTACKLGKHEYVSNVLPPTYPDGLDTEVFSFESLKRLHVEATLPSEREHVSTYIHKNPHLFRTLNVENSEDLSHLRWTVDRDVDLAFVREVYRHLSNHLFGMKEVLALLDEHPELQKLNEGIERNEGHASYLKSGSGS